MLNKKLSSILLTAAVFLFLSVVLLGAKTGAFAQSSTYPVATLTDIGDVNFFLQTQAMQFASGKWTYNFTWKRTRDAQGRFAIAPATNEFAYVVDIDPAERERTSSNPLPVKLDPSTRYVVKYFAGPSSLCNESLGAADPECAVIRSIYFNTRNESGKVMLVSEIPISRGGTSIETTTTTTTSGDQTVASLQAQINQLLAIVQSLLEKLGGGTINNTTITTNSNTPALPTINPSSAVGPLKILTRPVPPLAQNPYAGEPTGTQVVTAKVYTSNNQCKDFKICTNTGTVVCSNEQCPTTTQANTSPSTNTMTVTITRPPHDVCSTDTLKVCPNRATAQGQVFSGGRCVFTECPTDNRVVTPSGGSCDPYPEVCPDGSLTYRNTENCHFAQCPASAPKTEKVTSCLAKLAGNKFSPGPSISPHFNVSSQLAQQMKTWKRCHYSSGGAGFNHIGPDGKMIFTVSLADQRRYAQECADLFVAQAKMLGFDGAECKVGEYCGAGDSTPDSFCSESQYFGRAVACTLSEGDPNGIGWKTFVGEASSVVGNDFGASHHAAEPQGWYNWLWPFNTEIARKKLGQPKEIDVVYDAGRGTLRNAVANTLPRVPDECLGVINVSVTTSSNRTGTVSWQAPSTTGKVNIYLLTRNEGTYRRPGHDNDLRIEATLAEGVSNGQGVNTYNFTIPPESALPLAWGENMPSILYGGIYGGSIDQMVQRTKADFFVRVVADNGIFGDSKNISLTGQTNTDLGKGDYGTVSNPPSGPSFAQSCEQALPGSINTDAVGAPTSQPYGVTSSQASVPFFLSSAWYPNNFPNASFALRVAEDNGGRGEQAVRAGCPNASECHTKIDNIWKDPEYANGTVLDNGTGVGGYTVRNLKPNTKYWFRTAAICNAGQPNQVYREQVWSWTTKPATDTGCFDQCSAGQKRCMPLTTNIRQDCGNYDDDACLEWGSGSNATYDSSFCPLPNKMSDCGGEGQRCCSVDPFGHAEGTACNNDVVGYSGDTARLACISNVCRPSTVNSCGATERCSNNYKNCRAYNISYSSSCSIIGSQYRYDASCSCNGNANCPDGVALGICSR